MRRPFGKPPVPAAPSPRTTQPPGTAQNDPVLRAPAPGHILTQVIQFIRWHPPRTGPLWHEHPDR
jgi:hypothetical protein